MDRTKFKTILTVAIVLIAGSLGVILTAVDFHQSSAQNNSEGLVIDHGDWDVDWYPQKSANQSIKDILNGLVSQGKISLEWNGSSIKSIDGVKTDDSHRWGLWVITKGENSYKDIKENYDTLLSDYYVCTVAYTTSDSKPVPGTDYLGNKIFGYSDVQRTVSLSASITEMVCSLGGVNTMVGCDTGSDYPQEFLDRKAAGKITEVADFMSVSFEKIISVNPDMVFFDGSVTNSLDVAKKLKSSTSVNCCVLYPGWTVQEIMNNIFIVGECMGSDYKNATQNYLQRTSAALQQMYKVTATAENQKTGVVIMSSSYGDWGAGKETCVRDYIVLMNGKYGFDGIEQTWFDMSKQSELLAKINPDYIIVLSDSYIGESGYNEMLKAHPTWNSLKAGMNKDIYLLYDQANNIAQRLGPRFVECTEIFAKYQYRNQDIFSGQPVLPKWIGNDYVDYLTYTKGIVS